MLKYKYMEKIGKYNGNIYYIEDPNAVNINHTITNAIADYQDMNIFAELTAVRRGRSVIMIGEGIQKTGLENTLEVNFLGNNQNKNADGSDNISNPDYLNFTTNYYDGSTADNQIQYESFGISNIKVVVNSSYIPQINIQFIDLRGLSFFNQENSPYRILFDFPPPIFNLKFKGYYGKTLEYKLHLVKYTTEFKAENGNFVIDAQFVALTFAPLSDVLFRYIINFPLMEEGVSMNPIPNEPPRNTNELLLKLKNLYSESNDPLKTDEETDVFDNASTKLKIIQSAIRNVVEFKKELEGNSYIFVNDETESNSPEITALINPANYNEYIKNVSNEDKQQRINQRLCIGYIGNESNRETIFTKLAAYKTQLITPIIQGVASIVNTDISDPKPIYNPYNINTDKVATDNTTTYYIIDITDYYYKLYKSEKLASDAKNSAGASLARKINNSIEGRLGMRPTIYNIFKIILDDVDKFFRILGSTSKEAHNHHNNIPDVRQIISTGGNMMDSGTNNDIEEIYPFPLLIKKEEGGCPQGEVRTSPIELNEKMLSNPLPEMTLIENFILTFTKQRKISLEYNMKDETDDDGTKKWIPISPIDSTLSGTNPSTPYAGLANIDEMLAVLLERFYILTQSSLPSDFYNNPKDATTAYIELYSKSEALNLAMSLTGDLKKSKNVLSNVENFTRNDIDVFYTFLDTNVREQYAFTSGFPEVIDYAYVDRENPEYKGINIYYPDIETQLIDEEGSSPIDKFASDVQRNIFRRVLSKKLPEESYLFTQDNVVYIKDTFVKKNTEKVNRINVDIETRYLSKFNRIRNEKQLGKTYITFYEETIFPDAQVITYALDVLGRSIDYLFSNVTDLKLIKSYVKEDFIKTKLQQNGNLAIDIPIGSDSTALRNFQSIVDIWISVLGKYDTEMYDEIISSGATSQDDLASAIILSNFGYTLGPYNGFPNNLQSGVFLNPAAIDVPEFLPAYIGALVGADTNGLREKIEEFYLTGGGKNIESCGIYTLADIHDINTYLSDKDKEIFRNRYDSFMLNKYFQIKRLLLVLYNSVESENPKNKRQRVKLYDDYLNPESKNGSYFDAILLPLMTKTTIICFSQVTFGRGLTPQTYRSLKSIHDSTDNADAKIKEINNRFFREFFRELSTQISIEEDNEKRIEEENEKLLGDDDVITQLYYSFKNVNDKWLCNPEKKLSGYPYNKPNKDLIDSFVFVDRAMRPIGNTCINPEILLDLYNDTNISVFSVLSQLLSLNGFLFFPLQNFMSHNEDSWLDSFKIDPTGYVTQQEAFICVYAGGSSSYPNNLRNGFKNDGIIDISTTDAKDFKDCGKADDTDDENDKQKERNPEYKDNIFNKVRAFKVAFGQQNQSMFTDIKIDSKEFPETNESIQILARLAGDEGAGQPVPKGQNLYNLYENRAYSATITGLGNAMIQPTQYFQLDNVPLFNGAYLILGVEHNITPNRMETNFTGTKILKYPVPRVTSPAASMGLFGKYADYAQDAIDESAAREATEASMMTDDRLNELDGVLGIDISNYQGNVNWSQVTKSGVKFAFIKVTEGTWFYDENSKNYELKENINGAVRSGVKIGYYHFARPGSSTDPAADATEEANFFLSKVNLLPKPNFPLVLDVESFIDKAYPTKRKPVAWTNRKASMPIYIRTFINVLKAGGYDTIIYSYADFLNSNGITDFSKYPLWLANYMNIRRGINPETHLPTPPKGWQAKSDKHVPWSAWQFTSQGKVSGIKGNVDMNIMKKDFFNKYS